MMVSNYKAEWRFGQQLKRIREGRCLTQQFVAEACGITVSMLSAYENNHQMPSLNTVRAICTAIPVSADTLLGLE